jgi:Nif-specific regulatory protein
MEEGKRLAFLEELLALINSARTPEEMLNVLLDRFIEITGALTGSIMLIDAESQVLEIKAARGLQAEKVRSVRLKIGEGVTGRVARTGQALLIPDVGAVDYYVRVREDLRSELAVPLKLEERIIGVINVDSDRPAAFTAEHRDMLLAISNFVAQILSKETLIKGLKEQLSKQALLIEIAEILEEDLPLDRMFRKIMTAISSRIALERGMLVLLDRDDKLTVFDGFRLSEEAMKRGVYQVGEGVVGRVYQTGKGVLIKDVSREPEFLNRMKIRRGKSPMSFFALPIRYENKTVGVLSWEREFESAEDAESVYALAKLIATMISNRVHLYVKAEREKEQLLKANLELKERLVERESSIVFIGKEKTIREILDTVGLVADTEATVLVTGETGTGKEMIAGLLHYKSARWDKPFVSLNCAAIPPALLESELFGYRKGAFTGADRDRKGKFGQADGGTIFLDEIGDLDFNLQAKILRVLQDKVVEPVGADKPLQVDVRVVVATNKDLKKLAAEGKFREDLFYRINVINLHLPPLRERRDDIPLLAEFFLDMYNKKYRKRIAGIAPGCLEILAAYSWPGNIRELQNAVERAVILTKGDRLEAGSLPDDLRAALPAAKTPATEDDGLERAILGAVAAAAPGRLYDDVMDRVEKIIIDYALVKSDNNQSDAAALLGIHRNTLAQKTKGDKRLGK